MRVTDLETAGRPRVRAVRDVHRERRRLRGALHQRSRSTHPWRAAASGSRCRDRRPACVSQAGSTQGASASLVLTGGPTSGRGYLLAPSGELLSGPLTGAPWSVASEQEQCLPGTPGPDGQPTGALLAADSHRAGAGLHQLDRRCRAATPRRSRSSSPPTAASPGRRRHRADASGIADLGRRPGQQPGGARHRRRHLPVHRRRRHLAAGPGRPGRRRRRGRRVQLRRHDQHAQRALRCPPTPACTRCSSPPTAADLEGARGQRVLKSPAVTRSPRSMANISSSCALS